jgi:hypothetical protein
MYSLPSISYTFEPFAEATNSGLVSTPPNALTGELTPPGSTWHAREKA